MMKYILILLPLFTFAQFEQTRIIYRATSNDTLVVRLFNDTDMPLPVYLESSDSVYVDGLMAENSTAQHTVILSNGEVLKGRGASGITYTITKNGQDATQPTIIDSTFIQLRSFLEGQDGFNFRTSNLTVAQATRWIGFILAERYGCISPNGIYRFKRLRKYFN